MRTTRICPTCQNVRPETDFHHLNLPKHYPLISFLAHRCAPCVAEYETTKNTVRRLAPEVRRAKRDGLGNTPAVLEYRAARRWLYESTERTAANLSNTFRQPQRADNSLVAA